MTDAETAGSEGSPDRWVRLTPDEAAQWSEYLLNGGELMSDDDEAFGSTVVVPGATPIVTERWEPGRFYWRHLGPDEAAQLWEELVDWVDWFRSRYNVRVGATIRPCWYRHPIVVEELTAAMIAHRSAYERIALSEKVPHPYTWSPALWHRDIFTPMLARLESDQVKSDSADCTATQCTVKRPVVKTLPGLDDWIAEDIGHRASGAADDDRIPALR